MKTSIIGGGVMAEAMLSRAIAGGSLTPREVRVAEPVEERRRYLQERYSVAASAQNQEVVKDAGMVVLSVKPQQVNAVLNDIGGHLTKDQTVLSIVAGVPLARLTSGLDHQAVVRVMPNTPAQVGAGVSVWTATAAVGKDGRDAAVALLSSMGSEFYVEDEAYLDMATAISGSGPAYVFSFMEALTSAAVELGIPREMANTMVLETVLGSALLAKKTGDDPALLRERVTSPGGTTAEALRTLERTGFRQSVLEGVMAAYRRAQELAQESGGPQ
jgi:pyrroline-5-carboxylate reductase